jgi:hypothetical protein
MANIPDWVEFATTSHFGMLAEPIIFNRTLSIKTWNSSDVFDEIYEHSQQA